MTEYAYKGFKLCYTIEPHKSNKNLFGSYGYVMNPRGTDDILAKFHTDYNSRKGVQSEIKKLMEDYINFEWQQFHETAK